MRLTRLDLLRFGKFTDEILTLPHSKQDFHLVVGPNEAGKSTLRNAIQDLLFGIETRSRYNFLHAHSDMRLGALIEQGSLSLDFVRTKARTRTLQKPDGSTLRDDALMPFLGSVDRVFFDQMFGLNHERLVKGGQDILSASNNMGQILFQAAAGIGSLGVIRDRMEQEADGLWGPRKSDKREYYLAASALEQAEAALKNATVRTREWQEAAEAVEGWSSQLLAAHATYNDLAQHRFQLERVRRVGPMLLRLALIERELAELGPVVLLPAQAGAQLAQAEHELAMAGQSLQMHQEKLIELTESSASLRPDSTILARTSDIEALCAFRQKVSQHETDIAKRESEIRVQWLEVQESARQLAWPTEDEDAIAQRLPGALARLDLEELLGRHGVLLQTQSATDEALRGRQDEIKAIGAEISLLPAVDIPVMLVEALSAGRALGDSGAQEQRLEAQVARGERELHVAGLELGFGKFDLDELRQLVLPGQDECAALIRTRAAMEAELLTIRARRSEIQADESILRLEIAQYQATHKPVTQSDVMKVRHERDTRWQAIKAGDEAMAEGATGYESAVTMADHLADLRHGKAQQETELQSRLDRLQRLHLQVAGLAEREQGAAVLLSGFEQVWNERAQNLGLPGLALMQVNEYRLARERVLNLATVLWEARSAQAAFTGLMSRACSELALAMQALQPHADALTLSALILSAEQWIGEATRTRERRSALTTQMIRAQAALESLESRASLARAAIDAWTIEMHKSLAQAHLPIDCSPVKAKAALGLFERMHQHLQKIRETRLTRINLMRQDLDDFAGMAKALALHVAPALSADRPADISMQLDAQLKLHAAQAQQLARLTSEIDKVMAQLGVAKARVAQAHASLEPLLRASGAQNHAELRDAIVKSERLRQLKIDQDEALGQLLSAGDGLTREALAEEFALTDTSAAVTLLSDNQRQTDVIVSTQNRLSVELTEAQAVLGQIAGQGEAALAESQRQEALARMGNALERFIKVFTAAKLLRWSIEKFRETRQGPMLTCASQIFSGLTQGAFSKLVVDYENDPPKLSGQRATGEHVDIEGLSEGTRDQLYLALRLAALELHLEKTTPLPFIGDDLFINYDDGRARAGLQALARLSESTQVIFLSHHAHLEPLVRDVFGAEVNVIRLG